MLSCLWLDRVAAWMLKATKSPSDPEAAQEFSPWAKLGLRRRPFCAGLLRTGRLDKPLVLLRACLPSPCPGLFFPHKFTLCSGPSCFGPFPPVGATLTLVPSQTLNAQPSGDAQEAPDGALGLSSWPRAAGALVQPRGRSRSLFCALGFALP